MRRPMSLSFKQTNTVQGAVVFIWADLTRTEAVLVVVVAQVGIPGRPLKINGDPVGET